MRTSWLLAAADAVAVGLVVLLVARKRRAREVIEAIARGGASFDAPATAKILCGRGYAILDGFAGLDAVAAVRDGIQPRG